jgi:hypothetical protein
MIIDIILSLEKINSKTPPPPFVHFCGQLSSGVIILSVKKLTRQNPPKLLSGYKKKLLIANI